MKGLISSLIIILLMFTQSLAQTSGTVRGILRDKASGAPMGFATVALHDATTGEMKNGCVTDSTGVFTFSRTPAGSYYVEGSYVGCPPVRSDVFSLQKGQSVNVGALLISEGENLDEVVVEGHKSTFVAKLDRKVFNVGQDLTSSAGSASDIMQNIPSVDIDLDGNVSLRGNSNVTILINGKPSAMMGQKTRADALNQLSASDIDHIEVITNPTAEYKPDGMSGIINIVLKKETGQGLNGTLNANVGSYGRKNVGLNLNYGFKRVNLSGGYSRRCDRYDRKIDDHRTSPSSVISQITNGIGLPKSNTFRLGVNTFVTDNDRLEVAGCYNHRRFERDERVESSTLELPTNTLNFNLRNREALAKENMYEATFKYSHTYATDCEWGADYTYSSEDEDETNLYTTQKAYDQQTSPKNNMAFTEDKNTEDVWDANYLHVAKLWWRHKASQRLNLSMGYEMENLRAEQNYHIAEWDGTSFCFNADRSSDFTHLMTLNSLFATAELTFKRWNLMAGLRAEHADITNKLISQGQKTSHDYFNLFPTLHISWPVNEANELMLNYSMRINRPDGGDMNPFAEEINPLSLEAGNPDLKPEKINSVELGWLWHIANQGSIISTLYFKGITNQITSISRHIESGALLTTKENMQSSQNAGIEVIWSQPVARWFDFNLNANGYYNQIDASKLGFSKRRNTFSYSALLNANFRPFRHYMVQLNSRYISKKLVPQGKQNADIRLNLGMKYDIPALYLSIIASVTDLLDTHKKSYTLDTPDLQQRVDKRRNPRILFLGFAWQFGNIKSKKHNAKVEYDEGL